MTLRIECKCGQSALEVRRMLDGRLRFTIEGKGGDIVSFGAPVFAMPIAAPEQTAALADMRRKIALENFIHAVCGNCEGTGHVTIKPTSVVSAFSMKCASCDGKGRVTIDVTTNSASNASAVGVAGEIYREKIAELLETVRDKTMEAAGVAFKEESEKRERTQRDWNAGMRAAAQYQAIYTNDHLYKKGRHRSLHYRPVHRFAFAKHRPDRYTYCTFCGKWTDVVLRNSKPEWSGKRDAAGKVPVHMICEETAIRSLGPDTRTRAVPLAMLPSVSLFAEGSFETPRRAWRMYLCARELVEYNARITVSDVRIYRKLMASKERALQAAHKAARELRVAMLMQMPTLPYTYRGANFTEDGAPAGHRSTRINLTRPTLYTNTQGVPVFGVVHLEWAVAARAEEHRERQQIRDAKKKARERAQFDKLLASVEKRMGAVRNPPATPSKTCPDCNGDGMVDVEPHIPDVTFMTRCKTCNGAGLVPGAMGYAP
jgi:hypothetical protein